MASQHQRGNNVVLTGTERVMRGESSKAPRHESIRTEATISMSTVSSDGTTEPTTAKKASLGGKKGDEASDLLIKMITKEILGSMRDISEGADEVSKSSAGGSSAGGSTGSSKINYAALSDMILNSFDDKPIGNSNSDSDNNLRKMLKEGLEDCESIAAASSHSRGTTSAASTRTGSTGRSSGSGTKSTDSGLSGLSMNESRSKGPMDIWHPDFWNTHVDDEVVGEAPEASDIVEGAADIAEGPTIGDFLKGLGEISDEGESKEEDDASACSDITGLTGVFEDFPESRRKKKAAPKPVTVDTGSVVHSIISKSKTKKERRNKIISYNVRFNEVRVREFQRILTDNPACTKGPPIGIGWKFNEKTFDFDEWELKRGRVRRPSELHLNRGRREEIVRKLGYTDKDIAASIREGNRIKAHRRQTINNLGAAKMEEAVEAARRKAKKIMFLGLR